MRKIENNYAFIDGTNIHKSIEAREWTLNTKRFRVYLKERYGVAKAYYCIGYLKSNVDLYKRLEGEGYELVFKPAYNAKTGKIKGNIDSELVLKAINEQANYDKAVIVSSDGDFACLVKDLIEKNKFQILISPSPDCCSKLLKKASQGRICYLDRLRKKLEYIKYEEGCCKDKTLQHPSSS